jgi:tetratricopeptide (TPR) repeat protein
MRRRNRLVRLFRALSGMKQSAFGERTGVEHGMFAQYELDKAEPGDDYMERAARTADLTVAAGDQILRLADALRRPRQRAGQGGQDLFGERLASLASSVYERLLRLSLPGSTPRAEDRQRADELWALLEGLPEDQQSAVVRVARELQSWILVERICDESVVQASRDLGRAAALARLAREIAQRVRGPEGWRKRILGFAKAHAANIHRVAGELKAAAATFAEAKRLWHAGSDPDGLLDPGRLLDLEGSLLRGQRRFGEALARLDEAVAVGRCPGRYLINKGFTLEVMGEYERAIETLLEAESRPDVQGDPRLRNILHCNLGFNFCHVQRFAEAAELARQAHAVAAEMGDEIGVLRVTWLEGRIAAGLGRPAAARRLLEQARREFVGRRMWYDVALALLEEAVLLLDEGSAAEVKALAEELAVVFDANGVHREALAALRLFHEAVEREAATGELARRVLRYLFRAQHDPELRFVA